MMMKRYFFVLLIFLCACEPAIEGEVDKHFKDSKLRNIATKFGDVKVKLPDCFEEIDDYSFSWTNEHRYECERFNLYFSLDILSKKEVARLTSNKAKSTKELLSYISNLRASSLYDVQTGLIAKGNKVKGCQQYNLFQYGKWHQHNDELVFWYAGMECNGNFYLLQFMCIKDDFFLYEKHFKEILKTIEVL
jgi:hypothetical protein